MGSDTYDPRSTNSESTLRDDIAEAQEMLDDIRDELRFCDHFTLMYQDGLPGDRERAIEAS